MADLAKLVDDLSSLTVIEAAELAKMAQEFIALRDRGRELAGVMGKAGDAQFTLEQAQFGAETGFADPGKAVDFRTAFQGEAQQYADVLHRPPSTSNSRRKRPGWVTSSTCHLRPWPRWRQPRARSE